MAAPEAHIVDGEVFFDPLDAPDDVRLPSSSRHSVGARGAATSSGHWSADEGLFSMPSQAATAGADAPGARSVDAGRSVPRSEPDSRPATRAVPPAPAGAKPLPPPGAVPAATTAPRASAHTTPSALSAADVSATVAPATGTPLPAPGLVRSVPPRATAAADTSAMPGGPASLRPTSFHPLSPPAPNRNSRLSGSVPRASTSAFSTPAPSAEARANSGAAVGEEGARPDAGLLSPGATRTLAMSAHSAAPPSLVTPAATVIGVVTPLQPASPMLSDAATGGGGGSAPVAAASTVPRLPSWAASPPAATGGLPAGSLSASAGASSAPALPPARAAVTSAGSSSVSSTKRPATYGYAQHVGMPVLRDEARNTAFLGISTLNEDALDDVNSVAGVSEGDSDDEEHDRHARPDLSQPLPAAAGGGAAAINTMPLPRAPTRPVSLPRALAPVREPSEAGNPTHVHGDALSGGAGAERTASRGATSVSGDYPSRPSTGTAGSLGGLDVLPPSNMAAVSPAASSTSDAPIPQPAIVPPLPVASGRRLTAWQRIRGALHTAGCRLGWAKPALIPGLAQTFALSVPTRHLTRLTLTQRLTHVSTSVVRVRNHRRRARARARQAEEAAGIERRNSDRSLPFTEASGYHADAVSVSDGRSVAHSHGTGTSGGGGSGGGGSGGTRRVKSAANSSNPSIVGSSVGGASYGLPPLPPGVDTSSVSMDSQAADTASVAASTSTSGALGEGGRRRGAGSAKQLVGPLSEPIWTMKFSVDGQFLAAAGGTEAGAVVRVWRVRPWEARSSGSVPSSVSGSTRKAAAPVCHGEPLFESRPYREYLGHETHVVDVAWSRSNLLLTASMDSYVRLWHVSRNECLHKFQHPDCVTAVAFHPTEDNYFLTGCLDKKLRIWSLETGRVVLWQPTASMITAVAFSPDARLVAVGLFNGLVTLYRSDGLQYLTTIECRNRKGKHKKGRKVTGLEFTPNGAYLLVSTNDSRLRLVSMDDFSQVFKYIGLRNNNMQIRATFDETGERVLSGSEDRRVYMWRSGIEPPTAAATPMSTQVRRVKVRGFENFVADDCQHDANPDASSGGGSSGGTIVTPGPFSAQPGGTAAPHAGGWCTSATSAAVATSPDVVRPMHASMSSASSAVLASATGVAGAGTATSAGESSGIVPVAAAPAVPGAAPLDADASLEDIEARAALVSSLTGGRIATTVAIFAPASTVALARPPAYAHLWKRPTTLPMEAHDSIPSGDARAAWLADFRGQHFFIVAADSRGFIRVYENTAPSSRSV